MDYFELELKHQIDVKLIRLNKPKFNYSNIPLFGEYIPDYHKIDSNSDDNLLSNEQLLKNFNLTEILPISNLMMINNSFGKILFGETLEACLLIINMSKTDDIKVRDVKVVVTNEPLPNFTSVFKKCEFVIFEASDLIIPPEKYFTSKINFNADIICKYSITTEIQYCCNYFNNEYIKNSNGRIVKQLTQGYYIEQNKGLVIRKYIKKMLFDNNLPFKIKEKLVSNNLGKTFIEINLINCTSYTLHIIDYNLQVNKNTIEIDKKSFEELVKPICSFDEFSLEPDDEYNFIYVVENHNALQFIENFTFKVSWVNFFDSNPKQLIFIIKNKLVNDIIGISLYDSPLNNNIFLNDIFVLKLLVSNIHKSKFFKIKILCFFLNLYFKII